MKKFEQNLGFRKASEEKPFDSIEDVMRQALLMPEFQEAVRTAKSKFEAQKNVRALLSKHFPEITNLPDPGRELTKKFLGDLDGVFPDPPKSVLIAKIIIDALCGEK